MMLYLLKVFCQRCSNTLMSVIFYPHMGIKTRKLGKLGKLGKVVKLGTITLAESDDFYMNWASYEISSPATVGWLLNRTPFLYSVTIPFNDIDKFTLPPYLDAVLGKRYFFTLLEKDTSLLYWKKILYYWKSDYLL